METEIKILGYSFDEYKHGDKGVLKFEGKWSECAVSIETDDEGTTWVHLCTDEQYLEGREARETFGYEYSWAIAQNDEGKIFIYEEDIEDITHFFFLGGEKAVPTKKKHWKFVADVDGLGLKIHDNITDEEVCSVIHSGGLLVKGVDGILKAKGYYTYNFSFNEKGQIC